MISIIICSKSRILPETLRNNIKETIGCEYELITIDNSENRYSIYSAYNQGISQSNFPNLCLVHDDVEFLTINWGEKILKHLNNPKVGLVGVAGGRAMLKTPLGWTSFQHHYNITHSTIGRKNTVIEKKDTYPLSNNELPISSVLLDGVFLCAKKDIFNQIHFDENFSGFHGYDLDISMQAINAGYINYVVYDVDIKHYSKGRFDKNYLLAILKVYEKWEHLLPVFDITYTDKMISDSILKVEKNTLLRLRKRMIRAGMTNSEISPILKKYNVNNNKKAVCFFHNKFTLNLIRYSSILRNKMLK